MLGRRGRPGRQGEGRSTIVRPRAEAPKERQSAPLTGGVRGYAMEGLDGAEGRCRLVGRRMTKGSLNSCSATVQRADHTPQQNYFEDHSLGGCVSGRHRIMKAKRPRLKSCGGLSLDLTCSLVALCVHLEICQLVLCVCAWSGDVCGPPSVPFAGAPSLASAERFQLRRAGLARAAITGPGHWRPGTVSVSVSARFVNNLLMFVNRVKEQRVK